MLFIISLGVLTAQFPLELVEQVLVETERLSERHRDLPAHVMVYYAMALALYADASTREVLRCLLEGVRWLGDPTAAVAPAGKSGISQARTRLGAAQLEALYRAVVAPVATADTPGAMYRGWRVMSLDGTTLDVGDTAANRRAFGRPTSTRGANTTGAFPQLRAAGLVETGTHVFCGAQLGAYHMGEVTLAADVVPHLRGDTLCLADRGFLGFDLWRQAAATGAALVWRAKSSMRLPVLQRFADGSYRSELRWNVHCRHEDRTPIPMRVVAYTLPGVPDAEAPYRLVTSILDPARAPAAELAALYHERWEIETTFDEFKTHLRGAQRVLRSKTPELVRQEAWGFLLAHFALRALGMKPRWAPGRRRATPTPCGSPMRCVWPAGRSPIWWPFPPRGDWKRAHQAILHELRAEHVNSSRGRVVPRGVKRKTSNFPLRPRRQRTTRRDYRVRVLK